MFTDSSDLEERRKETGGGDVLYPVTKPGCLTHRKSFYENVDDLLTGFTNKTDKGILLKLKRD